MNVTKVQVQVDREQVIAPLRGRPATFARDANESGANRSADPRTSQCAAATVGGSGTASLRTPVARASASSHSGALLCVWLHYEGTLKLKKLWLCSAARPRRAMPARRPSPARGVDCLRPVRVSCCVSTVTPGARPARQVEVGVLGDGEKIRIW